MSIVVYKSKDANKNIDWIDLLQNSKLHLFIRWKKLCDWWSDEITLGPSDGGNDKNHGISFC